MPKMEQSNANCLIRPEIFGWFRRRNGVTECALNLLKRMVDFALTGGAASGEAGKGEIVEGRRIAPALPLIGHKAGPLDQVFKLFGFSKRLLQEGFRRLNFCGQACGARFQSGAFLGRPCEIACELHEPDDFGGIRRFFLARNGGRQDPKRLRHAVMRRPECGETAASVIRF
jgi:hypothetical protein